MRSYLQKTVCLISLRSERNAVQPPYDLTLRTSYSEGYRAPSLPELDSGSFIEQAALVDPKTANTTLTFGINNIFDTNPPFADEGYGFDPATTKAFGRVF